MSWIYLLIAGFFEVFWAIGLKLSNGFTNLWYSIFTILGAILSVYFLALAIKNIPIGTAYAVWTGIGTIGTVILGIILFKEPVSLVRFLCIAFILLGIIGLKVISV